MAHRAILDKRIEVLRISKNFAVNLVIGESQKKSITSTAVYVEDVEVLRRNEAFLHHSASQRCSA